MHEKILIIMFVASLLNTEGCLSQDIYQARSVDVQFFSSAPVEDIDATSKEGISVYNVATGEVSFAVPIKSFRFRKGLMQEHFNENFMESERYPNAKFRGEVQEEVNLSAQGQYPVTLVGELDVHGKKQKRTIPATLQVGEEGILLQSRFDVACKDHDIKIPRILWKNIAEVVRVEVKANYSRLTP